jgi:hypothetical protein
MSIFAVAALTGLLLPSICLVFTWKNGPIRRFLLGYILFQLIQVGSERLLAANDLRYVIKYIALGFVLVRLVQLFWGFLNLKLIILRERVSLRTLLLMSFWANAALWLYVAVRLILRITT